MDPASFSAALWLGLLAGGAHAVTGPDHMAGLAPFAAAQGRKAWRVGLAWGIGHAAGAALAALIALGLRAWIPDVEAELSALSERVVGIVLCVVGTLGLRAALRRTTHTHAHDGLEHAHISWSPFDRRPHTRRRGHPAFIIGLLHGSAGLSHLFAVLPALALPGFAAPALYLAGYGAGSLLAITGFAGIVGGLATDARRWRVWITATSMASLVVGLVWTVHPF